VNSWVLTDRFSPHADTHWGRDYLKLTQALFSLGGGQGPFPQHALPGGGAWGNFTGSGGQNALKTGGG
jgi:hypothetical protein